MNLQINGRKRVQVECYFPSITTEGPANSDLRGISVNRDCPQIVRASNGIKGVYGLYMRQGSFLQGEFEQLSEHADPSGMLISCEIC